VTYAKALCQRTSFRPGDATANDTNFPDRGIAADSALRWAAGGAALAHGARPAAYSRGAAAAWRTRDAPLLFCNRRSWAPRSLRSGRSQQKRIASGTPNPDMWLLLLFSLALPAGASSDTLHAVDLYGMRAVSEASLRAAIGLRAGDPVPVSDDSIRARVRALPGVAEVHVSTVCCSETGRSTLYVGIREVGTPPMVFRAEPSGAARLPGDILAAGVRFESALVSAVQRGETAEDGSQGYSLAQDSALRSVQEDFLQIAADRADTLTSVLRNSTDATHRALAAQVLAYGANRQSVARELLYAAEDPSDAVRNNATRALAVLVTWVDRNPLAGVAIPPNLFVDFLNSVSWTDRNKGVMVLVPLTASRDSALLAQLRSRALPTLVEMARWTNAGHALGPFLILARIAGLSDGDAFQAWQAGDREAIIARAIASGS
jgi:hypothetical protein